MFRLLSLCVVATLSACGAVVGDACTVNSDCGPGICLNRNDTPGGMCSVTCTLNGTCPAGSLCVWKLVDSETSGCAHVCTRDADCRAGYTCEVRLSLGPRVCIGPVGTP